MTNIDRAADVIYDTLSGQYGDFCVPTDAAQALADAGLLAPDIKETPMSDFPRGYQLWSDYQDEAPEDLANRLRAELIDAIDRLATTLKENK